MCLNYLKEMVTLINQNKTCRLLIIKLPIRIVKSPYTTNNPG